MEGFGRGRSEHCLCPRRFRDFVRLMYYSPLWRASAKGGLLANLFVFRSDQRRGWGGGGGGGRGQRAGGASTMSQEWL